MGESIPGPPLSHSMVKDEDTPTPRIRFIILIVKGIWFTDSVDVPDTLHKVLCLILRAILKGRCSYRDLKKEEENKSQGEIV